MSNLPRGIQKQLKNFISKTSDEAIDFVVNLTGKYIDEKKRKKLRKEAELKVGTQVKEALNNAFKIGLKLREECQQKKLEASSAKEEIYSLMDACIKPFMPVIPEKVHTIDYLFQVCEELRGFRFNWNYLEDTKYIEYLQSLKRLVGELGKANKTSKSWEVLNGFINSKDFYSLLQATVQRLMKHYEFLARNLSKIEKRQFDRYLDIYWELSGAYEKFISLIATLIRLLQTDTSTYEGARKRSLYSNLIYVKKSSWKIFVAGFNRNIRNAIAHKTFKVDILEKSVEFTDRKKTLTLTFREVQNETEELSALLLILPHVFVSIFCLSVLSIKEMLNNLSR